MSIWAAVARAQHHQYVLGDVPAAVRLLRRCVLQTARARAGRGGLGRGTGTGTGRGKSGGRGTLEDALQEGSDDGDGPAGDAAAPAIADEEEEDEEDEEGEGSDVDSPERAQARLIARAERASLYTALGHALMESGEDGAAGQYFRAALRLDQAFAPASRGLAVRLLCTYSVLVSNAFFPSPRSQPLHTRPGDDVRCWR